MRDQEIPEIPGYTGSIPEAVTWRAIARRYRTRYVNEAAAHLLAGPGDTACRAR